MRKHPLLAFITAFLMSIPGWPFSAGQAPRNVPVLQLPDDQDEEDEPEVLPEGLQEPRPKDTESSREEWQTFVTIKEPIYKSVTLSGPEKRKAKIVLEPPPEVKKMPYLSVILLSFVGMFEGVPRGFDEMTMDLGYERCAMKIDRDKDQPKLILTCAGKDWGIRRIDKYSWGDFTPSDPALKAAAEAIMSRTF